jgi:hypothetical protein
LIAAVSTADRANLGHWWKGGYVFVFCTPADFHRIREIEGVHQFVRIVNDADELEPMPFPKEALGDLMARQVFGEFDETT